MNGSQGPNAAFGLFVGFFLFGAWILKMVVMAFLAAALLLGAVIEATVAWHRVGKELKANRRPHIIHPATYAKSPGPRDWIQPE